ncbi:TIGR01459 family HAD-type hydrolase [Acidimangrovimonas pyrenivorans]|uniref:TIGR01459 family HAD-type hydrolase n=1 Tax=Acidimangrovimonas pyrenivorans TaxID=2030798 RepID=A0ABV7ALX3_9RHOB
MTRILQSLAEIGPAYDALFCDLWGCLHNGQAAFPEAVAALQAFRSGGGKVVLLTNAPRPKPSVLRQLDRLGVPRDAYDEVVTSGDAAQYALVTGAVGQKVYHLGPAKDDGFFTEMAEDLPTGAPISRVPLEEAEGIVCTGLFDDLTETPEDYRATLLYAKAKGLKLLCANPDIVVDLGDKRIFCAGAIARAYDKMGGESLYFGKPWPPIYDLARRRLAALAGEVADRRILAIGDGIATDIKGAVGEGLDALFVTGGLAAEEFGPDPARPDPALVDAYLERHQMTVTAAIARLR